MAEGDQIISVDTVDGTDTQSLEAKVKLLTGKDVRLDDNETIGKVFETVDPSIPAVLVRKDGGGGSVYVIGDRLPKKEPFVTTGPDQGEGFVIVLVKSGQTCHYYGNPSVRYFRLLS